MSNPEQIFARIFRKLHPRTRLEQVTVEFRPFANVNSNIRLAEGRMAVRISDMLQAAPESVIESLAFILISKLYRQPVPAQYRHRYQRFLNRSEMRRQLHIVRQVRGRKQVLTPKGEFYDLEEMFQQINARYFDGLLGMPLLGWSQTRSRVKLGHYDPSHNTIVISRLFDAPRFPRHVVEYLLYHEMLHLKHPVEHGRSRRRVHPAGFNEEERRFERYEEARRALTRLLQTRD